MSAMVQKTTQSASAQNGVVQQVRPPTAQPTTTQAPVQNGVQAQPTAQPTAQTLARAFALATAQDKPIMCDYWEASVNKTAVIGIREIAGGTPEKMLVKSEDEYTSPIFKLYSTGVDYIVETENSIYLVSASIVKRKIT
jgi:hypothetical protein